MSGCGAAGLRHFGLILKPVAGQEALRISLNVAYDTSNLINAMVTRSGSRRKKKTPRQKIPLTADQKEAKNARKTCSYYKKKENLTPEQLAARRAANAESQRYLRQKKSFRVANATAGPPSVAASQSGDLVSTTLPAMRTVVGLTRSRVSPPDQQQSVPVCLSNSFGPLENAANFGPLLDAAAEEGGVPLEGDQPAMQVILSPGSKEQRKRDMNAQRQRRFRERIKAKKDAIKIAELANAAAQALAVNPHSGPATRSQAEQPQLPSQRAGEVAERPLPTCTGRVASHRTIQRRSKEVAEGMARACAAPLSGYDADSQQQMVMGALAHGAMKQYERKVASISNVV